MESAVPEKMDVIPEHQHAGKQMVWVPPRERIVIILVGLVGSGKAGYLHDRGCPDLTCPL
jgi:hypothetical protein